MQSLLSKRIFVSLQAGQRAAIEVIDDIRPQCLSSQDYILLKKSSSYAPEDVHIVNNFKNGSVVEELWFSNVFLWTLFLPFAGLGLSYVAFKLRDAYCHLVIPTI